MRYIRNLDFPNDRNYTLQIFADHRYVQIRPHYMGARIKKKDGDPVSFAVPIEKDIPVEEQADIIRMEWAMIEVVEGIQSGIYIKG
jgi:hypothetical protein